ncbi:hypothetical protein IAD21_00197 [Abditibacteriota bacterium]|nr:hypothetical protein IAD21_00197 [Abditibacteriota bacterium]
MYDHKLFLKALVIMVVLRLTTAYELWQVLHEPTCEMATLRALLTQEERFPCRRTWERRLAHLPDTLPTQIATLGRFLVEVLDPFAPSGRAVALDSTLLRAFGGRVWHKKDKQQGVVPHSGIDIEAGWTKSGHHGWGYGWKLHLSVSCGAVWIPLAAELTPANCPDNEVAPRLVDELPLQVRFVLGDTHYNAPNVRERCELGGQTLIASGYGAYPRPESPLNSQAVRSFFHKLRSITIENFNQQFKTIFDAHRPVPTKGRNRTQNWALGAILTYQLLLFHRWKHNLPLRIGLKYALKAT